MRAAAAKRQHQGICLETSPVIDPWEGLPETRKCKAQRSIDILQGKKKEIALGNDVADRRGCGGDW